MHKLELSLYKETHKTIDDFVIQARHLTPAIQLDLVVIDKIWKPVV